MSGQQLSVTQNVGQGELFYAVPIDYPFRQDGVDKSDSPFASVQIELGVHQIIAFGIIKLEVQAETVGRHGEQVSRMPMKDCLGTEILHSVG